MQINAAFNQADTLGNYASQSIAARGKRQAGDSVAVAQGTEPAKDKHQQAAEQRAIQALKDRDREVRAHEQAHLAAAGGIAVSGATFSYTTGPDGQRYAIGGEVGIDTSDVPGDPQATLRKADTIRRAALAPAQPSAQDYNIAAQAQTMSGKAAMELLRMQREEKPSGSLLDVTV